MGCAGWEFWCSNAAVALDAQVIEFWYPRYELHISTSHFCIVIHCYTPTAMVKFLQDKYAIQFCGILDSLWSGDIITMVLA